MAHRLTVPVLAGIFGSGLLASHAASAQTAPAPETPVIATLSEQHALETDSFGPPLEFGAAVAIEGKTAFVGAAAYANTNQVDSQGNPTTADWWRSTRAMPLAALGH